MSFAANPNWKPTAKSRTFPVLNSDLSPKMKTAALSLLLAIPALYARAAHVIPPELVGEWHASVKRGAIDFYVSSAGSGTILYWGRNAIGEQFTATYNPGTHVLKLKILSPKQNGEPKSIQLIYDPAKKTMDPVAAEPNGLPLIRKNSGVPDGSHRKIL